MQFTTLIPDQIVVEFGADIESYRDNFNGEEITCEWINNLAQEYEDELVNWINGQSEVIKHELEPLLEIVDGEDTWTDKISPISKFIKKTLNQKDRISFNDSEGTIKITLENSGEIEYKHAADAIGYLRLIQAVPQETFDHVTRTCSTDPDSPPLDAQTLIRDLWNNIWQKDNELWLCLIGLSFFSFFGTIVNCLL